MTPRLCTYCKHPYGNPCDGQDRSCLNRVYLESKGKAKKVAAPAKPTASKKGDRGNRPVAKSPHRGNRPVVKAKAVKKAVVKKPIKKVAKKSKPRR